MHFALCVSVCVCQRERKAHGRVEQDLSARVGSGCLKTRGHPIEGVFSAYVSSTLTPLVRSESISTEEPKACRSQTASSLAFDCRNVKEETEKEERNESEIGARGGGVCVRMRRRQAAHAGSYS